MSDRDSDRSSGRDRDGDRDRDRDSGSRDRGGDLYSSDFGDDVKGGNLDLDKGGKGKDHASVFGDDRHFSWDIDTKTGEVSRVHGWEHRDKDTGRERSRW